jgi:hypothetical protein
MILFVLGGCANNFWEDIWSGGRIGICNYFTIPVSFNSVSNCNYDTLARQFGGMRSTISVITARYRANGFGKGKGERRQVLLIMALQPESNSF